MSVKIDREKQRIVAERDLRESGGCTVLTIPPTMLDAGGLVQGDTVEFSAPFEGEKITLRLASGGQDKDTETEDATDE